MKLNPASACVCTACMCVWERMCRWAACVWVKTVASRGRGGFRAGEERGERDQGIHFPRGVFCCPSRTVCVGGGHRHHTLLLCTFFPSFPFEYTHTNTLTHTHGQTHPFSPQRSLSLSLSPPTSLILSAGEWMVFRVNYVWLRDDGEWMDLRGSVRVERGAGIHIGV